MTELHLEQAVYGSQAGGGYRFLARSPGFGDDWLAQAERLCTGFGERPAGVSCPSCVFAQPFGRHHVAVVQVADQGRDDAGRPGALGFHLVVLLRDDYVGLGGDPFAIADRCPPPWVARGELPALTWPAVALPARQVEQVQRVLQRSDGPVLLGATQVLVDGGRLVFERPAPDTELLRSLWTLLPTRTRSELWPASFAFGNALGFHSLIVPPGCRKALANDFINYRTEDEAGDCPEGRYELNLQMAAEASDQRDLDALFARRTRGEMWRLGLYLLAFVLIVPLLIHWLTPAPEEAKPAPPPAPKLELPANDPSLGPDDRARWLDELRTLATRVSPDAVVRLPWQRQVLPALSAAPLDVPWSAAALASQEDTLLLAALDRHLGTPDPERNPGPLFRQGTPLRQLRTLLWKHGVKEYNEPGLNYAELLERLRAVVARR